VFACVYYCSNYCKAARVEGDRGGHVLWETTSQGLCGLVCPAVCVDCLFFKVTEPSPLQSSSACAERAAYPDPEQTQRHHPASLSSESGESLRHVGCYSTKGVCVYYCRTYYKAVRVGDSGGTGHVLRETTSRGLCGLVCPSRTSERGGEGYWVKEGGGAEGEREKERALGLPLCHNPGYWRWSSTPPLWRLLV